MTVFAVTGASGKLGRSAVQELLDWGVPAADVVAIVRTRAKVADFLDQGVEVREADYSESRELHGALEGIDRLLLVSSSETGKRAQQHANVIEAARAAGARRIVYTSMLNADDTTNPLAAEHRETERTLCAAEVPFTLLRNGWYTENYIDQLGEYLRRGEIIGSAGRGRVSAATRRDYAAAASTALLRDGEENRLYELGGPAFDLPELARVITEVTRTPVTYTDLPVVDYAARLQQTGVDPEDARFAASLDASIANGDLETSSEDLAELIGPVTSLGEAIGAAHV